MIKHLLIDFDRTLNDSDLVYERSLDGFLDMTGKDVRRQWEVIHQEVLAREPREKHEDLDVHFEALLTKLRRADRAAVKDELQQRIRAAQQECWDATALFDDAIPFLARMKGAGYTLHLATGDYAQQKAEAIELQAGRDFFVRAFDESVLGVGKGKRDYFDRLLSRLGSSPAQALVLGDSLTNDIGPAREAGMEAVWVRRGNERASGKVPPVRTIPTLAHGLGFLL